MSNVLKHRFTSPKLDGPDLTQVQPSAWNDGHQFSGGLHGDVLTRDTTDGTFGAAWQTAAPPVGWIPYTPTWYVGGTAQALGTHSFLSANYFRRGNAVWFQLLFQTGSGALPAGEWAFGLPVPSIAVISVGTGFLFRGSVGVSYPLWLSMVGFTDRVAVLYLSAGLSSLAPLTTAAPVALGASEFFELRGNYQAA